MLSELLVDDAFIPANGSMRPIIDIVAPSWVNVEILLVALSRVPVLVTDLYPFAILDCSPLVLARVQGFTFQEVLSLFECQHAPAHLLDVSF